MIKVRNLNKIYNPKHNPVHALVDINLDIPYSKRIAIVGKSGSGKSTLMQVMSTLDWATSGEVLINDDNILQYNEKQLDTFRAEKMGFIFQNFYVDDTQNVQENISLPLEIIGENKATRKSKIEAALKSVDLLEKSNTLASELSGGQRQRLAIARAIVNKPKILFADEPTGNLDSQTGAKIIQTLFDLTHHLGTTLIMVTHDNSLAKMCDIIFEIKDGRATLINNKEMI